MNRPASVIAMAAIALAAAGCASVANSNSAASQPSASGGTPSTVASSPDCHSEGTTWRNDGGQSQVDAVVADLNSVQHAAQSLAADMNAGTDESSAESSLQSAAASLGSDAQAAEANLPPACIPGFRTDYGQALTDLSKAAADWQDGVSELSNGNGDVATGDINAGTKAQEAGNAKLSGAAKDLEAFGSS